MDWRDSARFSLLEPLLKPALRARLVLPSRNVSAARYGGVPAGVVGEAWPRCEQCTGALTFFAQFPAHGQLWRFFWCRACKEGSTGAASALLPLPLDSAFVPHPQGGLVASPLIPREWVLEPVMTLPFDQELEGLDPAAVAGVAALVEIANESDGDYRQSLRTLSERGVDVQESTRIGGYANPLQDPILVACPACARPMPFLARLASHDDIRWEWGDMGFMFLHVCPAHPQHFHAEIQSL